MTTLSRPNHDEIEAARSVEARIVRTTSGIRRAWNLLAADLYEFHEQTMWQTLGYESLEEWLASPEVELGRRHVFGLIEVYRDLVINRQIDPEELGQADVTKVRAVLPAIKRGDVEVVDALADCEALSRSDLSEKYGKGRPNERLDAEAEPEKTNCPRCGSWVDRERLEAG